MSVFGMYTAAICLLIAQLICAQELLEPQQVVVVEGPAPYGYQGSGAPYLLLARARREAVQPTLTAAASVVAADLTPGQQESLAVTRDKRQWGGRGGYGHHRGGGGGYCPRCGGGGGGGFGGISGSFSRASASSASGSFGWGKK